MNELVIVVEDDHQTMNELEIVVEDDHTRPWMS
jgi:hypothetical protein